MTWAEIIQKSWPQFVKNRVATLELERKLKRRGGEVWRLYKRLRAK